MSKSKSQRTRERGTKKTRRAREQNMLRYVPKLERIQGPESDPENRDKKIETEKEEGIKTTFKLPPKQG